MQNTDIKVDLLESRRLLASTGGLPELAGILATKAPPAIILPSQKLTASVKITNSGGDLSKTSVPIGIYISGTAALDSSAKQIQISSSALTIKSGKSKNVSLKFNAPSDIPADNVYILFQINDNSGGSAIPEVNTSNNLVASPVAINPLGQYAGAFSSSNDSGSFSADIEKSGSKLTANFTANTTLGSLEIDNLKCTISTAGAYSIKGKGHATSASFGAFSYNASITGTLDTTTDHVAGNLTLAVTGGSNPFSTTGSFDATKSA